MEINLKLIKISWFKTILRPLNLLIVFLPVYTYDKFQIFTGTKFWGLWSIFWLIIFFLQLAIIKRYTIIGQIKLNNESIKVFIGNKLTNVFTPEEKLIISIEYNGYEGAQGKYMYPLQLPLINREGIGSIHIIRSHSNFKFNHLCKKDISKILTEFACIYEQKGNKVIIIWNK